MSPQARVDWGIVFTAVALTLLAFYAGLEVGRAEAGVRPSVFGREEAAQPHRYRSSAGQPARSLGSVT